MSPKIKKLFTQVHKIPQIPEVVKTIIDQFNNPNIDMRAIAKNVEKEQIIALKVLRQVNSAAYGLPKKIASIDEAVVMLGMARLRSLVIASGIVSSVPTIENFDINQFWLNSFNTANYAKWLAEKSDQDADIAFTAGLISGLGIVIMHLGMAKEMAKIESGINQEHSRYFVEKMRLGFTSQDVCAELCQLWKFSDDLITPIAQCADPLAAKSISKISCILFIAQYFTSCIQADMTEDEILKSIPLKITNQLGLSGSFFTDNLTEILALESGLADLIN